MIQPTPPSLSERIQELVFQYLERVDGGEGGSAVLAELAGTAPELEDGLRRAVDALKVAGLAPDSIRREQQQRSQKRRRR